MSIAQREKFCIVHPFPEHDDVSTFARGVREELKKYGITLLPPKMGTHATLIAPFYDEMRAIRQLARGLSYVKACIAEQGSLLKVKGGSLFFFRNEETSVDTLVIRFEVPPYVKEMVEQWRNQLPETASWVHPNTFHDYSPHISIGEGEETHGKVSKQIEDGALVGYCPSSLPILLGAPHVMRKVDSGWIRVT